MKQYFFLLLSIMAICLVSCVDPPVPESTPVQYTLFNPPILLTICSDKDSSYHVVQPMDSAIKLYGKLKINDSIDVNQDGIYDLKFYLIYGRTARYRADYMVEPLHDNIFYCKGEFNDTIRVDDTNWIQDISNMDPNSGGCCFLSFKIMDKDGAHVGWIRHRYYTSAEYWYIESMAYSTQPYYEFVVGEKK